MNSNSSSGNDDDSELIQASFATRLKILKEKAKHIQNDDDELLLELEDAARKLREDYENEIDQQERHINSIENSKVKSKVPHISVSICQ